MIQRRNPARRIALIAGIVPAAAVVLALLAFLGLGIYVRADAAILPNISIADAAVDITGLSRDQAINALIESGFEERGKKAEVTVEFPDGSALTITGADAGFHFSARQAVDEAETYGHGDGFFRDAITYLRHNMGGAGADITVDAEINADYIRNRVYLFTDSYNEELENSEALVYEDKIVVLKGAGQVSINGDEIYELMAEALFQSMEESRPIKLTYDLPPSDTDSAELWSVRQSILTYPLSAYYDPDTDSITESVMGVDFSFGAAKKLLDGTPTGKTATIAITTTQPEITREYLEQLLFRDIIGECVTNIGGSANRLNNIQLATAAVNGYVVQPGEEFSFNNIVGKRTPERGFKAAPAFSNGETVLAIGGGICQVSSTIYSSIKDTDILVTERRAHGQPVSYLPRGRDATVSWGQIDFKFVNNTMYPIRIEAEEENRVLSVKLYGTITDDGFVQMQ